MIDPRTADLMERDLEGSLGAAERAELDRRLAASPEARALHAGMAEVTRHLAQAGDVPVPASLRSRILSAVSGSRPARAAGRPGWLRRHWPAPVPVLRYAAAVAAGLILGLAAVPWLVPRPAADLDLDSLAGTMAGAPAGAPLAVLEVGDPGLEGRVVLRASPAGFLLEPDLRSPGPVEVSLIFDPGEVRIRGFLDREGDAAPFRVTPGQLSWTHTGSRRYAVVLAGREGREADLTLEFEMEGRRVHGGRLRLPGPAPSGSF